MVDFDKRLSEIYQPHDHWFLWDILPTISIQLELVGFIIYMSLNFVNMAIDVLKKNQLLYIGKEVEENKIKLLDLVAINSDTRFVVDRM